MSELTLKIVTPSGAVETVTCNSVRLNVCADKKGNGQGSYGIRSGHIDSLLMLEQGALKAFCDGKIILSGTAGSGFATVEKNTVTVVVEDFIL